VPFRSLEINIEHCYPDVLPCGLVFVTGVPFCTSDVLTGQLILQFIFNCVPFMACLPHPFSLTWATFLLKRTLQFSEYPQSSFYSVLKMSRKKKHLAAACSIFNAMVCAEF
jgi:hypothetical protein